jgi:hypothetical protein|tara:strand:+ start:3678 stop:4007 length:330 start_codon:yes stop_codon:yes gene_type:complete
LIHDNNCDFENFEKNTDDCLSCDVQWLMFSKGYVLYDGGDMEWHKPEDIENCQEKIENCQVLTFTDVDHLHNSEGCLKNFEKYDPKGYAKHMEWRKEQKEKYLFGAKHG